MTDDPISSARRRAVRDVVPFVVAMAPFALVYGVAVADSSVNNVVGVSASWLMFAGAAQLSVLDSIDAGAAAWLTIATAVLINLRFGLYSAALAPAYSQYPLPKRMWLVYGMADQVAALVMVDRDPDEQPDAKLAYAMTCTTIIVCTWWVVSILGATVGATIPDGVDIGFAMPLMFLMLALPALRDRPSMVAGAVGATAAVVSKDLPQGANIVVGGLLGISAGRVAQLRLARRQGSAR